MSGRVLLGISDVGLAQELAALVQETADLTVGAVVTGSGDVLRALQQERSDAVLLHSELDSMPVMELARRVSTQHPDVAVVVLVEEPTEEVLRAAMQAGARGVIGLPLSLDEIDATLTSATTWAQTLSDQRTRVRAEEQTGRAKMVAIAGGKGGVGATTIAVQLALRAAKARSQSVCLVDLDLQAGDVRLLLDIDPRRTVSDLIDVHGELAGQHFDETLYRHPSGLRVLLPPRHGERGEDLSGPAAGAILGGIRSRFDIVIVDVGTIVTEANAVAVELADEVVVVATPDVPALRSTNRLLQLWERLDVSTSETSVLLNRVSKELEVQPELARKVLGVPVLGQVVPAGFMELEPAMNSGAPDRLENGAVMRALDKLAEDVGVAVGTRSRRSGRNGSRKGKQRRPSPRPPQDDQVDEDDREHALLGRLRSDGGAMVMEFTGIAWLLIASMLLVWQIVLVALTFVLAGNAAREGAQAMAVGSDVQAAAASDLPAAWVEAMEVEEGDAWVEVRLGFPILVPSFQTAPMVTSRMGTVIEE